MAILNPTQLGTAAQGIATATAAGSNTAAIVGGLFQDIVDSSVFTVKVTLSSAEILALNTTPKTVVAAQGANTLIRPLAWYAVLNYNSSPYSGGNINLAVGSMTVIISSSFYTNNSNIAEVRSATNLAVTGTADWINAPLVVRIASADPTGGNSTVNIFVTYTVISVA
jgi:hypothetical protein